MEGDDNMLNIVESIESITESSLDRQARDIQFMQNIIEQEQEMERFINESLIKASGNKRAINEMYLLNEAAAGDKIKGFFEKIKNFFKKIFSKLGASMSALFSEQKTYCDKYAHIITKCKWQAGDVSDINNYFVGIPRIIDMVDNNIESALFGQLQSNNFIGAEARTKTVTADMVNTPPAKLDANEEKTRVFNEFAKAGYWANKNLTTESDSNGVIDIDKTFRSYFNGSADTIAVSGDEIENQYFQTIINVTYAGQSYLNKLEKIVTSVDKKMDEIQKSSDAELKDLESKLKAAVGQQNNNNQQQTTPQTQQSAAQQSKDTSTMPSVSVNQQNDTSTMPSVSDQQQTTPVNSGYEYEYGASVNEVNIQTKSSAEQNKDASKNYTGVGTANTTNAGKANTAVTNQKVTAGQAQVSGNVEEGKIKAYMDVEIHNEQAKVNAMIQVTSAIARSAFAAFKGANSDFFKIIQAHVQWYLSNPGSENEAENQTTRARNLDLGGGLKMDTKQPPTTNNNNNNGGQQQSTNTQA